MFCCPQVVKRRTCRFLSSSRRPFFFNICGFHSLFFPSSCMFNMWHNPYIKAGVRKEVHLDPKDESGGISSCGVLMVTSLLSLTPMWPDISQTGQTSIQTCVCGWSKKHSRKLTYFRINMALFVVIRHAHFFLTYEYMNVTFSWSISKIWCWFKACMSLPFSLEKKIFT